MKMCPECKELKLKTDFYTVGPEKKYLNTYCKKCSHKKASAYNAKKRRGSPEIRKKNKSYDKHNKTHLRVWKALKKGAITKSPCVICGTTDNLNAHHEDYDKPLDVIWYCFAHHMQIHADKNRQAAL